MNPFSSEFAYNTQEEHVYATLQQQQSPSASIRNVPHTETTTKTSWSVRLESHSTPQLAPWTTATAAAVIIKNENLHCFEHDKNSNTQLQHVKNAQSPLSTPMFSPVASTIRELLYETHVERILIRVGTETSYYSSFESTYDHSHSSWFDTDEQPHAGPSGISIQAYFSNVHEHSHVEMLWNRLLLQLVSRRILLAPLISHDMHRERRATTWEQVTNNDSNNRTWHKTTLVLPFEYMPLSGESLYALARLWPGETTGLFHGTVSPYDWSNLLLRGMQSQLPHRRGFYMDFQASPSCHGLTVTSTTRENCTVSSLLGIQYSMPVRSTSGPLKLSDLLPISHDGKKYATLYLNAWNQSAMVHIQTNTPSSKDSNVEDDKIDDQTSSAADTSPDTTSHWVHQLIYSHTIQEPLPVPLETALSSLSPPYWTIQSHIYRHDGLAHGGILYTILSNHHTACPATVQASWTVPPFVTPLWQTLQVFVQSNTNTTTGTASIPWTQLERHTLTLAPDRTATLQWQHTLAPQTALVFSLTYAPSFVSFEAFPTDANRGFELPPLRAHFESSSPLCMPPATLYGPAHLVLPPLPDRSMPFNVLSLVCTLYAFLIGSVLNILVRKGSDKIKFALYPELRPPTLKDKLRAKAQAVKAKLARMLHKRQTLSETTTPTIAVSETCNSEHVINNPKQKNE
jgi:hypothetical protein